MTGPIVTRRTNSEELVRTAVIILGMHRSGTSALAGTLSHLGVDLPQDLMRPNPANPKGYFESQKAAMLNDALLKTAGSAWCDLHEVNPEWYLSPRYGEYMVRAAELLTEEFGTSAFFLLKDPRICRLLPFWRAVLDGQRIVPRFVCIHRHPQEVGASLSRREGWSASRGLLLWLRHVLDAEAGSRGAPRVLLSYDMLLSNWQQTVRQIGEGLNLHWPINPGAVADDVSAFLSESLRHHKATDRHSGQEDATDYGGSTEFITTQTGFPVEWTRVRVDPEDYVLAENVAWAEPSIGHAAKLLRSIYENPVLAKERGKAGFRHLVENHSFDAVGRKIVSLLRKKGLAAA